MEIQKIVIIPIPYKGFRFIYSLHKYSLSNCYVLGTLTLRSCSDPPECCAWVGNIVTQMHIVTVCEKYFRSAMERKTEEINLNKVAKEESVCKGSDV